MTYEELVNEIEEIAGLFQDRERAEDLFSDLEAILYMIEDFKAKEENENDQ